MHLRCDISPNLLLTLEHNGRIRISESVSRQSDGTGVTPAATKGARTPHPTSAIRLVLHMSALPIEPPPSTKSVWPVI